MALPDTTGPDADGLIRIPCATCARTVIIDARITAEFVAYAHGPRIGRPVQCNACFGYRLWSRDAA